MLASGTLASSVYPGSKRREASERLSPRHHHTQYQGCRHTAPASSTTASIFALMPAFVFESVKFSNMILDGKEMLYAGVLSSGVAFLLQIYGQQNLSPAPVAIIFSLEGVFASIFGWIILSQFLNEIKIAGIILILFAVIFSQLAPIYDKKKYG